MLKERQKYNLMNICVLFLALCFTLIPLYNIIIRGVYKWHIVQPESWQGGLEVIGFIAVIYFTSIYNKKNSFILMCILSFVYLSLNGVLIPVITVYLYFESICYIGNSVLSFKRNSENNNLSKEFITGISVWGAVAILCSLAKLGSINDLRIMTIVLLLSCVVLSKGNHYNLMINRYKVFWKDGGNSKTTYLLMIGISFLVFILFAKTNTAIDYDSTWYGLRPEQVLVGKNSFYDFLGYSAFVYYYPKLVELFFLPISGLKDYSFIISGNIFVFILLLNQFYKSIISHCKITKNFALASTIIVCSIPAISNIAATAKPDILGAYFLFSSFLFFINFLKNKNCEELIFSFVALLLATGTKLTYFLWGGIFFASAVCCIIILKKNKTSFNKNISSFNSIIVLSSSMLFIMGVHFRTLILTGYPLYPILINVFNKIGFSGKYPLKTESINIVGSPQISLTYLVDRLYKFIFDPNSLGKIIMLWTSTVLIFLLIVLILSMRRKSIDELKPFYYIIWLPQIIVMVFYMLFLQSPDGNYFITPIMISIYIMITLLASKKNMLDIPKRVLTVILCLFMTLNSVIMFVSHPSWAWGTKKFNFDVVENNYNYNSINESIYKYHQINNIAQYLNKNFKGRRVLSSYLDLPIIDRVGAGIETEWELENMHLSNKVIMSNYEEFIRYISFAKIEGFILLNNDESKYAGYVKRYITEYPISNTIIDEGAIFYEVNNIAFATNIKDTKPTYGEIFDDGWMSKELQVKMNTGNGILNIDGYVPEDRLPNSFKIFIGDKLIIDKKIENTAIQEKIDTGYINLNTDIRIVFSESKSGKEMGINNDEREVSIIIKNFKFE